ncbi:MAG: nitrate/sulfonate/bicarbonate ABC transporter ATP-binding protein [Acidobacteriota bacterium]|nr:nitrate/sulfonate/bicarbonate ABC transporter ATP-binding protein [Acidobacteriota bacterium]
MPGSAEEPIIEARGVTKSFALRDNQAIEVIAATDVAIYASQIVALLGPSGSGKSTLLRMLAGLEQPSSGQVLWHGQPQARKKPNVAIVFQSFALFPWLTVLENVEAPLQSQGVGAVPRRKRALKILDTVGLDGYETAYPKELSGGMKQRVGFARALVVEPEVLFMDEPFSALDVLTAENLRSQLLDLWLEQQIPTRAVFLVTHNIEEAIYLADRIIVIGRNPARIRAEFEVRLPHPRDQKSESFINLVDYTYKVLTQPELEALPPVEPKAPEATGRGASRYPALPHTRPDAIVGLMEMLSDRGGRDDLYRLADEFGMEVDDLLPLVNAAELLHFVRVQEGDVEITPEGQRFAAADILTQKELFRSAALENVTLLKQIDHTLRTKSDHRMPDAFFLGLLDDHFTNEEAQRQFDTTINWGRFAEIFDYDSDTRRLFLPEA